MNREIKFRTWDKEQKKMMPCCVSGGNGYPMFVAEHDDRTGSCFLEIREDMPIMQFTGLKDKNDQEIWEGDIIQDAFSERKGEVYFSEGAYCIDGDDLFMDWIENSDVYPIVIGNIHDNPDLLK